VTDDEAELETGTEAQWAAAASTGRIAIEGNVMASYSGPHGTAGQPDSGGHPAAVYYPDANWQRKTPSESGVDPGLL
jgi:hypothetical protein